MGIKFSEIPSGSAVKDTDKLVFWHAQDGKVYSETFGDMMDSVGIPPVNHRAFESSGLPRTDYGLSSSNCWGHVKMIEPDPLQFGYMPYDGQQSTYDATHPSSPTSTLAGVLPLRTGQQLINAICENYTTPHGNDTYVNHNYPNTSIASGQYILDTLGRQSSSADSYRLRKANTVIGTSTSVTQSNAPATTICNELYTMNSRISTLESSSGWVSIPSSALTFNAAYGQSITLSTNIIGCRNDRLGICILEFGFSFPTGGGNPYGLILEYTRTASGSDGRFGFTYNSSQIPQPILHGNRSHTATFISGYRTSASDPSTATLPIAVGINSSYFVMMIPNYNSQQSGSIYSTGQFPIISGQLIYAYNAS